MSDVRSRATSRSAVLLVKNAGANLVRAVSTSAMTVILPILLVLVFEPHQYAVVALVFSIGAYVNFLDLGIPTTIQAMVGRALAAGAPRTARLTTFAGVRAVATVGMVCLIGGLAASAFLTELFPEIPRDLVGSAAIALPIVVLGQVSVLVGNAAAAYFSGRQQSHIPMLVLTPTRLVATAAAVASAAAWHDIALTALAFSVPLVVGSLTLLILVLRSSHGNQDPAGSVADGSRFCDIAAFSGPLAIWGICMLVTTGIGVALVARLDYSLMVPYSIATSLVAALAGAQSAILMPWLPELGKTVLISGMSKVARVAERLSAADAIVVSGLVALMVALAPWLLPLLTKQQETDHLVSWVIVVTLLIGNATHLFGTPLTLAFIATKTHQRIVGPPVAEAAISLGLSLWLGLMFGAVGVAIGVFVASLVGLCLGFSWSLRLSGLPDVSVRRLFRDSLAVPLLSIAPVLVASGSVVAFNQRGWSGAAIVVGGFAVSITLLLCSRPSRSFGRWLVRKRVHG